MMTNKLKADISNAEFEVLDVLWDAYPATSSELVESLNQRKVWHDKTVRTLLSRLVKKHVIDYKKDKRQYLYYPLIAREEYTQTQTTSFISRLFKGKVAPMIAGFSSQNSLTKEDVKELKAFLEQWERDND